MMKSRGFSHRVLFGSDVFRRANGIRLLRRSAGQIPEPRPDRLRRRRTASSNSEYTLSQEVRLQQGAARSFRWMGLKQVPEKKTCTATAKTIR